MASSRRLFNFIISDDLAHGLKTVKERDGISESEQVRRAVADWLKSKGVLIERKQQSKRKR